MSCFVVVSSPPQAIINFLRFNGGAFPRTPRRQRGKRRSLIHRARCKPLFARLGRTFLYYRADYETTIPRT